MLEFSLAPEGDVSELDAERIRQGVRDFNAATVGEDRFSPLHVYARDPGGDLIGGLVGGTYWSWLHIDSLWVQEDQRRNGYGSRLLSIAENEALNRGCKNAFLDTFSFQARPLYESIGYRVVGTIVGFPATHTRCFMVKALTSSGAA